MAEKGHIKESIYNKRNYLASSVLLRQALEKLLLERQYIKKSEQCLKHYSSFVQFTSTCARSKSFQLDDFDFTLPAPKYAGSFFCGSVISHAKFTHCHDLWHNYIQKKEEAKESVASITRTLRKLKFQQKRKFSRKVQEKIVALVKELRAIFKALHKVQRKFIRQHRQLMPIVHRDIRATLRHTVPFIFKYLPDFSGCEEEGGFNTTVRLKPLFVFTTEKSNELRQTIFTSSH